MTHDDDRDTLRKIAEDAFLLARNITRGDLGEGELDDGDTAAWQARREYRAMELVIDLGERLCRAAGIADPWVPDEIADLIEVA